MIETENESLRERVCDLEKKVLEQGDEIVCLRSTLADVLRRLNQLEGSRTLSLNTSVLKNGNTPRTGTFTSDYYCYINQKNQRRMTIGRVSRRKKNRTLSVFSPFVVNLYIIYVEANNNIVLLHQRSVLGQTI